MTIVHTHDTDACGYEDYGVEMYLLWTTREGQLRRQARSLDFGLATNYNKSYILDGIIDILGENSVHNVEFYSNHRIDSSIEDSEDKTSIHNLQSL